MTVMPLRSELQPLTQLRWPRIQRLGLLSATFRLIWRLLWRYAFGRWLAFHLMRLMPDLVTDPTLISKTTTSALATPGSGQRRIVTALIQATPLSSPHSSRRRHCRH